MRLARISRASSWRSACWPPWAWWASACCRAWQCRWAPRCCTPCVSGNPRDALLGRQPGESVLGKLHLNPEAQPVPGTVIWLFESPVWFFNADTFRRRAREVMDQAGDVQWFVLDAEAMTQADADAVEALYELKRELDARGMTLLVAGGHGQFRTALERSGLVKKIGRDKIFGSPNRRWTPSSAGASRRRTRWPSRDGWTFASVGSVACERLACVPACGRTGRISALVDDVIAAIDIQRRPVSGARRRWPARPWPRPRRRWTPGCAPAPWPGRGPAACRTRRCPRPRGS